MATKKRPTDRCYVCGAQLRGWPTETDGLYCTNPACEKYVPLKEARP